MSNQLNTITEQRFPLRPYKPWELCKMYGIDRKTFLRWLDAFKEELGERKGHYYTAGQVEIIVENLGVPGKMIADEQ